MFGLETVTHVPNVLLLPVLDPLGAVQDTLTTADRCVCERHFEGVVDLIFEGLGHMACGVLLLAECVLLIAEGDLCGHALTDLLGAVHLALN